MPLEHSTARRDLNGSLQAATMFPPHPSTPLTPAQLGLSDQRSCSTATEVATAVSAIVAGKFSYTVDQTTKLSHQLGIYFAKVGVTNESFLSMMKGKDTWPSATTLATTEEPLELITVPVTLLLSDIAGYTERVLERNVFLTPGVTYKYLSKWIKATNDPGKYDARSSHSSTTHVIKVDRFEGDALSGYVFVRKVNIVFTSNAVAQFLTDAWHCYNNSAGSGALAARICESIADSSIIGYLASKLQTEDNCAVVWTRIAFHLSREDVMVGRVMSHWQDFFKLRCKDKNDFPGFYSKAKTILHKLRVAK